MSARIEIDYGLTSGPLVVEVDAASALGVRRGNGVDEWFSLIGAREVRLVLPDDAESLEAPAFVQGATATRDTFAAPRGGKFAA